ncbi:GNAT family N-acetyltransferase [Streptomyces sp. ISL-11]|uniref:GNAT family N-acetyltransferase n=1 Tax=Streptomyces sp. ISL-11 TaxID=2819174 RepID=UPI001BEA2634|nr:GNAT family N-acetyltransferase [Streptomyces sp. ISL-11]MBT2385843.1 GNAT family N-acetyltransferase [Streptomyces sp. ISL-11]
MTERTLRPDAATGLRATVPGPGRAGMRVVALTTGQALADGRPARIAALTRAAYHGSDPLPGLPIPDGATETEAGVRADVARGATVWLAQDPAGEPAGTLRVHARPDGAWEIGRVSVGPAARGRGVARILLRAVETTAAALGVPVLRLDAVVERCLPSLYARLGFTPVRHWPSDDKPLTEVTMERRPGAAVDPGTPPWAAPGPDDLCVRWLTTPAALIAVVGDGTAAYPGARLAGIDVWHGAAPYERAALTARLAALGRPVGDTVIAFPSARAATRAHLMPRTVEPRLHAWCRLPPGAELPLRAPSAVPTAAVRCT